jgi:flagellum-specific peptidoglycan hydrolase FlgJ
MVTKKQAEDFIGQIADDVVILCEKYGISYPSAVIAHACNESKYGQSSLGKNYNNLFGMKISSSWKGKKVRLKTKEEYKKGVLTPIYAYFKVFENYKESIEDYLKLVTGGYYTRRCKLKESVSCADYIDRLMPVYCTSTTQAATVKKIVIDYNLLRYDTAYPKTAQERVEYYPMYDGYSISLTVALSSVGADSSYNNRKKIAIANGIIGYKGTSAQNIKLLEMLKKGKLIKV